MQKLKGSFAAVFTGKATHEQFAITFFSVVPITLLIVMFFMLNKTQLV
jgi:hypothetical protein